MIELPYPPTVNNMYRPRRGGGLYLSKKARAWKEEVFYLLHAKRPKHPLDKEIVFNMWVYPPDKRKRDSSNIIKAVEDSLVTGGWIVDDRYVIEHHVYKCNPFPPAGKVEIIVSVIKNLV